MRKMRNYRDYLIEGLSDFEEAISYLQTELEEYQKDGNSAALYYGFSAAVEGQGGFTRKTHRMWRMPCQVETLIANIIAQPRNWKNTKKTGIVPKKGCLILRIQCGC